MTPETHFTLQEILNFFHKAQYSTNKEINSIAIEAIDYIWKEVVDTDKKPQGWQQVSDKEVYELRLSTETYPRVYDSNLIKEFEILELDCYWKNYGMRYLEGKDKKEVDRESNFWDTLEDYCTEILISLGHYDAE
jgi:hypothetical protein